MRTAVELEQAALIHRAETRWLQQCAARLQRASSPRPVSGPASPRDEEASR